MDANYTLYVQQVCENLLYYAIAVKKTMLAALNAISVAQANSSTTTAGGIVWMLNYAANHPDATI